MWYSWLYRSWDLQIRWKRPFNVLWRSLWYVQCWMYLLLYVKFFLWNCVINDFLGFLATPSLKAATQVKSLNLIKTSIWIMKTFGPWKKNSRIQIVKLIKKVKSSFYSFIFTPLLSFTIASPAYWARSKY